MKKIVAIILLVSICLSALCGCNENSSSGGTDAVSSAADNSEAAVIDTELLYTGVLPEYETKNGKFEWDGQYAEINVNDFPQPGANEVISWVYAYYPKPDLAEIEKIQKLNIKSTLSAAQADEILASYFGFGIDGYIKIDGELYLVMELQTDAMYGDNYSSLPLYYVAVLVNGKNIRVYRTESMNSMSFSEQTFN